MDTIYWAAEEDAAELGRTLAGRVEAYGKSPLTRGVHDRYALAYRYYFGIDANGVHATSQVLRGGKQGELSKIRVNHVRPLVNTLLSLIVAQDVVWQPRAVNVDYSSLREQELARSILDYYWRERSVKGHAVQALEQALVGTEGFVHIRWDDAAGEDYAADPDTGATIQTGDLQFRNVPSVHVIRDPNKTAYENGQWVIVQHFENKWDLAAQHPAQAESIISIPTDPQLDLQRGAMEQESTDDIPVYYFYHKKCPSIPAGKETLFLADGTVLADSDLTYPEIPLYRVAPAEMFNTPFGYSSVLDILGVQALMDSLHTIAASNNSTLGRQVIAIQEGSEINPDDLVNGLSAIYYPADSEPPQALQLVRTPRELYDYLGQLQKQQELLVGLNSVVRGEPQSGEQSGSALALLQTQAIQQSSTIQGNYIRFIEAMGTAVVKIVQERATVPRQIAIAGKANAFLVTDQEYTGESIARITRVQVEIGSPLAQTPTGRIELARDMLQSGALNKGNPEQYLQVVTTGRIEPLTQSLNHELLLIKSENEQLARAQLVQSIGLDPMTGMPGPIEELTPDSNPVVTALDDHMLHVREHRGVLANPEARKNPAVVRAVLEHISEHQNALMTTDPNLLMLVGQQPLMPPGMPMDPNAPPEEPSQPPGPSGAEMPKQPKNPATGEQWNPADGGGAVPTQVPQ